MISAPSTDAAAHTASGVSPHPGVERATSPGASGSYEVRTDAFEGPLDLLLHLILREDVDIYDVRLSDIVDGYLAYLEQMERFDLALTTEFLLTAATLVELKSRRLLPTVDEMDLDEELSLWDERELLLHRLVECKTFKQAAHALQALAVEAQRSRPRRTGVDERYVDLLPDLLSDVTADDIRQAYLTATAPKPVPTVDLQHVAPIRASVTDALLQLADELPRRGRASFRALTRGVTDRIELVVRFLAVLELYKRGMVDLDQTETFGDISIIWLGSDRGGDGLDELETVDSYDG
jgi:segregation and condensation protein A